MMITTTTAAATAVSTANWRDDDFAVRGSKNDEKTAATPHLARGGHYRFPRHAKGSGGETATHDSGESGAWKTAYKGVCSPTTCQRPSIPTLSSLRSRCTAAIYPKECAGYGVARHRDPRPYFKDIVGRRIFDSKIVLAFEKSLLEGLSVLHHVCLAR
jgi:hypothetical protein